MIVTRETLAKIGIKDIQRVWKNRAPETRLVLTDERCAGFMLVTNSASQTWSVEYRLRGVDSKTGKRFPMTSVTIGTPGSHSPDQALAEALRIKGATKTGKNPAAERKAAIVEAAHQRSTTVERAVADYLVALPTKPKKSGGRVSEAWTNEQAAHLNRAVAALGIVSDPLASIDAKTVRKLQQGEAYRHRFGALNRFLDWAVHEDRISANPCASIGKAYRPSAGGKRDRTPTLRELALIWRASEVLEPVFCDFARFAICVPARRGEIARLDWRRIDLDARVWRLVGKATKNRDWHELRLGALALEILTRLWEAAGRPKTGLVFPSPLSGTAITAFSGMLRAIHRAAPDVERWALHDLRRSFGSALARLKEYDEETIDGILNHRQSATRGGVRGVYLKSTSMPAQHAALERWGALLVDALEGRFPEDPEVIPLARRARP